MRRCPTCNRTYPDGLRFCPQDGVTLVSADPSSYQPQSGQPAQPARGNAKKYALFGCLGLLAIIFACGLIGFLGSLRDKNRMVTRSTNQPAPASSPSSSPVSSPSAPPNLSPLKQGVILNATVQEDPARRPTVTGETNLPDGTEGLASIQSKTTKEEGSDKFIVQGGRFKAGPFGDGAQGLEPGNYTLDVTVAIAQVQPPQVRAVIGQNGENLRGPLVERGDIGTSVILTQDFQLDAQGRVTAGTDKAAVEKSLQASLKEARDILQALQKLERQGREMEALRGNNIDKIRQCGDLMRARQSEAKALRARAEALPRERHSLLLAAAAGELNLCVSCMSRAMNQCDIARGSLDEAAIEIRNPAR